MTPTDKPGPAMGDTGRSFPEAGDGRPTVPMQAELWAAGCDLETARFVATQLRAAGLVLEQDWQPIATAPKTSHDVLIFTKGLRRIGFWDEALGGRWSTWPGREEAHPTHWRPLPAPPTDKGGA